MCKLHYLIYLSSTIEHQDFLWTCYSYYLASRNLSLVLYAIDFFLIWLKCDLWRPEHANFAYQKSSGYWVKLFSSNLIHSQFPVIICHVRQLRRCSLDSSTLWYLSTRVDYYSIWAHFNLIHLDRLLQLLILSFSFKY